MSGRRFGTAWVLTLAMTCVACGGAQGTGISSSARPIDALRARAAANPGDAELASQLAEAELLWEGGDPARARAAIDRALALRPDDPVLHFLSSIEHEQHGRIGDAFVSELAAIESARTSSSPLGPAIAELLVDYAANRETDVRDHRARLEPVLRALVDDPGKAGLPARIAAASALAHLLRQRGEARAGTQAAARAGCIQRVRVAGPFGTTPMIAFDATVPGEGRGPLDERYDLGGGRGEMPTAELESFVCGFGLGEGLDEDQAGQGTWVVEAMVEVREAGPHVLLVRTPNTFRATVDGERVTSLDLRTGTGPDQHYVPLTLAAGSHEIEIVIATRHPNPFVSLALARSTEAFDAARGALLPDGDGATSRLVAALIARRRGDLVGAREIMRTLVPRDPTATLLIMQADVTLGDPFLPDAQRRDLARRLLERAGRLDPEAWYPRYKAAQYEQGERESLAMLRETADRYPQLASLQLEMAERLASRGRTAEADAYIARAKEAVPTSCVVLEAELQSLRRRGRSRDADERVDELLACDARSRARLRLLMRQRRWEEAAREIDRLAQLLDPEEVRNERLGLATATGDDATVRRLREEMAREDGVSYEEAFPLGRVDELVAAGDRPRAMSVLASAIERRPSRSGALRRVHRAFGGGDELFRYRMDGLEAIRRFEASGRRYDDASHVLVLDYMVVRLHEDGSSEELVHQIYRVQSDEAIEQLGQISLPGYVLTLRTIKPDGRQLEPDSIEGLQHIELPNLAVGDYVEYEFIIGRTSTAGEYRSNSWFFQNFHYPFDFSRLVLVAPDNLPVVIEPRGPVPAPVEERRGRTRVLTWTVEESRPLVDEPLSATSPERLPQLDLGVRAGWGPYFDRIVDGLMDKDPHDPAAVRLVTEILGARARAPVEERARILHRWVLENIEDGPNTLAPIQVAARAGNRNRVLRYLLELAGIEARIVFARALGERSPGELHRDDVYPAVMVMIRREDGTPIFTSAAQRGIPFGYVAAPLRGQEAIVLEPGHPTVTIGDQGSRDDRDVHVSVVLAADGSARVTVREHLHGSRSFFWRQQLEGVPEAELARRFEEGYVIPMLGEARLVSLEITGREDTNEPLILHYVADVAMLARAAGGGLSMAPLFPSRLSRSYATLPSRETTETVLGTHTSLTLRLRAPGTVTAANANVTGPGGAYAAQRAFLDGSELVVQREVHVPPMLVTPREYPEFARFCMAVDHLEAQEIRVAR